MMSFDAFSISDRFSASRTSLTVAGSISSYCMAFMPNVAVHARASSHVACNGLLCTPSIHAQPSRLLSDQPTIVKALELPPLSDAGPLKLPITATKHELLARKREPKLFSIVSAGVARVWIGVCQCQQHINIRR
jgi:hypothetical protein